LQSSKPCLYFQPTGNSFFYVINPANFSPYPDPSVFQNNRHVEALLYSDNTQNVSITLDDGTKLSGTGYTVVQFTLADDSGQHQSFAVDEYSQHPNGYYDNCWQVGGILGAVGVLFLAFTFLAPLVATRLGWGGMVGVSEGEAHRLLNKQYGNPWRTGRYTISRPGRGGSIDPKDLPR
jgi:hypothetical protein